MPNELEPIISQWYMHYDKGEMFRVVAVDAMSGSIEIQSFDGDVEEVDASAWRDMDIGPAEPPEDWTGPYDDIKTDDLGMTDTQMSTQDWRRSIESVQSPEEPGQDTQPPDELDGEEAWAVELYGQEQKSVEERSR